MDLLRFAFLVVLSVLSTLVVKKIHERKTNPIKDYGAAQLADAFLKYAIALEYIRLENIQEAIKQFELLLSEFPNYLPTYYQAAKLWEETGEIEKAVETYNKGIALAKANNDTKTLNELKEALMLLTDE